MIICLSVRILTDHAELDVEDPQKALERHEDTFLSPLANQNGIAKANISKPQIVFELLLQFLKKVQLRNVQNVKRIIEDLDLIDSKLLN